MESKIYFLKGKGLVILLFSLILLILLPLPVLAATWNPPQIIDSPGDVGEDTSIALDLSGNPRISYYDRTNGDLKYASFSGTTWSTQVVDSSGNVGRFTSLVLDLLENPHISYVDATTGDLKYASFNGTTWDTQVVDSAVNVGRVTSLALDLSGNPHISYHDVTNQDLKYASFDGAFWSTQAVDSTGNVGWWPSLALDLSGNPHISYYDWTNGDLKYTTFNGITWDTQVIDAGGDVGRVTSLALDLSGNPHISYLDLTNSDLKYASFNGTTWSTQTIDSTGGEDTSLALDLSGNPHIGHSDSTNSDLKYTSFNGTTWSTLVVDSAGEVGWWTSLALGGRDIHLSYYDSTNDDLKYVSGLASPPAKSVERLWGATSPDTAIEISKKGWPNNSSRAVIVARDDFFTDALAGGPLAYKLREVYGNPAPILLTPSHNLYPGTGTEIQRLGAKKVYILGGEGAIDNSVKDQLQAIPGVESVERYAGQTAYGTALAIKAEMVSIASSKNSPPPTTAIITTGENFPDALVISGAAAKKNMPILMVKPLTDEPQPETRLALSGITQTIIVGGPGAVHPNLENWLNNNGYPVQKRLWGTSEYDTAIDVASSGDPIFNFDEATTFLTRGDYFTDALAGGAYASRLSSPVVLVKPESTPEITRLWLTGLQDTIFKAYILGGSGAVSNDVQTQVEGIVF